MALPSFAGALACLALLYTLMPKLPMGFPRLLLVLPCLPVLAWVPFSTRSDPLRAILSFSFLWLCPAKLLLLSWDLSTEYSLNHGFLYFVLTTVLPLHAKGKAPTPAASTDQGASFFKVLKFPLFLVLLNAFQYRDNLPFWQILALNSLLIYFGLELLLGSAAKLATVLLGVEIYPQSDNPFLASSLSEFWGRRWNLVASHMLRLTVYAPSLRFLSGVQGQDAVKKHASQCLTKAGKDAGASEMKTSKSPSSKESLQSRKLHQDSMSRHQDTKPESSQGMGYSGESKSTARYPLSARAMAMLATFVVSGLIHELIFWCINQAEVTWEVTMFFILHGFATVLEGFARRELPSGWKFPRPIAIFGTLGFVFLSAGWLFMPPVLRAGSDKRVVAELLQAQSAVVDLFRSSELAFRSSERAI